MRRSVLIALIIVVVVLAAAIVIMSIIPDSVPEDEPVLPTPVLSETTEDLINELPENVSSIHFIPREGTPYTLNHDPASGYVELDAVNAIFPGFQFALDTVFMTATTLRNISRVTDAADDEQLVLLGFNSPEISILITLTDGTSHEMQIGAQQAVGQGRYARIKNSREVFLLDERQSLLLTRQLEDLYDISFLPPVLFEHDEESLAKIKHIILETNTGILEVRRRSDEEVIGESIAVSLFQILQPFTAEGSDMLIISNLHEKIAGIMPDSVVESHPPDLSVYGLDIPVRLTLTVDNWTGTILIGKANTEQNGRYIMIEGYDAVLIDQTGDYSFINVNPGQLRSQFIWFHFINDISAVTFNLSGVIRTLRFEHNTDGTLRGWLDDIELSENNARRLFIGALGITQSGSTDESIPLGELPVYIFSMNLNNGDIDTIELYQLNDSQFLIVYNDKSTGLFITRMSLQRNLLDRFDILDSGGDLPAM